MKPVRWLKRLSVDGAVLKAMPGQADRYAVYPAGDLRRRPLAAVSGAQFRAAMAEGWLKPDDGGYTLADAFDHIRSRQAGDFRQPHALMRESAVMDGCSVRPIRKDISASPLARWMRPDKSSGQSWLTEDEFEAGERLRADYHRSMMTECVTSDWNSYLAPAASRSNAGREDAPVSALAAQGRVRKALQAVGPGLDRVLSSVCLQEVGLEIVEAGESWPRRSGKVILKLALQRLGQHYGMTMPG